MDSTDDFIAEMKDSPVNSLQKNSRVYLSSEYLMLPKGFFRKRGTVSYESERGVERKSDKSINTKESKEKKQSIQRTNQSSGFIHPSIHQKGQDSLILLIRMILTIIHMQMQIILCMNGKTNLGTWTKHVPAGRIVTELDSPGNNQSDSNSFVMGRKRI